MTNIQKIIDRQYGNHSLRLYEEPLKYLRCKKPDEHNGISGNSELGPPIFACRFSQKRGYEHLLALANEEGQLAVHDTEKNDRADLSFSTDAHYNAIFDLAWMVGELKIVTASGDHTARLFDVSGGEIVQERVFHGHVRSVKTVAFRKGDPASFATGSRDGSIYLWDIRATVSSNCIKQPIISNSHCIPSTPGSGSKSKKKFPASQSVSAANSVTCVIFQDDNTLISCGAGDGVIKIWDLRKNYSIYKREPLPKYSIPHIGNSSRNGFSNLTLDSNGSKLYANCMDNNIYCYNALTFNPEPVMTYYGHQNSTFYIKSSLSYDNLYLLSGSSDQNAYIWSVTQPIPLVQLTGHSAEVTCVAWRQSGNLTLVTCSDDMKYKIWRVHPGELSDEWPTEGRGQSEPYVPQDNLKKVKTPSTTKRRYSIDASPSVRKRIKTCENCQMLTPGHIDYLLCQNCKFQPTSSKRKAQDANLNLENESKRQNTGKSSRCLFDNGAPHSSELATILEEFPTKIEKKTKYEETDVKNEFSVTENLPNFVIDGQAPHLGNYSPKKKPEKDWLTKLRIERELKTKMSTSYLDELYQPSSPKQMRLNDISNYSPREKKQKCTPSRSAPLLRYFKVTNNPKPTTSETQCSPLNKNSISQLDSPQRLNL